MSVRPQHGGRLPRAGSLALALLLVALGASGPVAADYYEALAAWERGDHARAIALWLPLAEAGDAASQYWLGRLHAHGLGVARDPARAAEWYRRAAEAGHAGAQNNLGLLYELGEGLARDLAEAARWYAAAAEQGDAAAQVNLARLYDEGRGVAADAAVAASWYRKAARQGHAAAQHRLGRLYAEGRGVERDDEKAAKWLDRAAERGSGGAGADLRALRRGALAPEPHADEAPAPVELGEAEAAPAPPISAEPRGTDPFGELLARAGEGSAEAAFDVAESYRSGKGVVRDLDEAERWYLAAAEGGHPMAMYRMAFIRLRGAGTTEGKDHVAAHVWFSLAADRGVGDAAAWRERIETKMSVEELEQAARLRGEREAVASPD